jgi:hypothetical protein
MPIQMNHTFLSSASFITSGSPLSIMGNYNPLSKLVISLTAGSATTSTLAFKGKGIIGNYSPIAATNLATNTSASQTINAIDQIWVIPIAGLRSVICDLTAISGSVTAKGLVII